MLYISSSGRIIRPDALKQALLYGIPSGIVTWLIYGLFNRFNVIGVKVDANRCNHRGACVRRCGMDARHASDHECIHCGKCMEVCKQGAIPIQAGQITLKAPEKGCAGAVPDLPVERIETTDEENPRFPRLVPGDCPPYYDDAMPDRMMNEWFARQEAPAA